MYLVDSKSKDISEDILMLKDLMREDLKTIICLTKRELVENTNLLKETFKENFKNFQLLEISAVENQNIQDLKNELSSYVEHLKSESNVVITNQRHYEALQKSLDSVHSVEAAISGKISTELLAYELRNALEHLGEISGEFTNDEVLGNIFSKFCIGK